MGSTPSRRSVVGTQRPQTTIRDTNAYLKNELSARTKLHNVCAALGKAPGLPEVLIKGAGTGVKQVQVAEVLALPPTGMAILVLFGPQFPSL